MRNAVIGLTLIFLQVFLSDGATLHESSIAFQFYNPRSELIFKSNSIGDDLFGASGCNATDKVSLIIHGWLESCETKWVQDMVKNLNTYRGGCVACMNYHNYSKNYDYFGLVRDFQNIAHVLKNKLDQFVQSEFDPENIFIFGFSFGGQLAIEASRQFGKKLIGRIDACEPAGPGFDSNLTYSQQNPMDSATFVQCIHTSFDKGTTKRNCHQNWHMGDCGNIQIASGPYPMGSHGLCPHFYNSAFENPFLATPRPKNCATSKRIPENLPSGMAMGYLFNDQYRSENLSVGYDYYAKTFKAPPYNIDISLNKV